VEYYAGLRGVTERGEWGPWIEYFLTGVTRQSEDALARAARINGFLDTWRRVASVGGSATSVALVDLLGENPYWTTPGVARRLGVAYTTAQRAIQRLEAAAILTPLTDARRDRVYCARAILEVLEEPAGLTPPGGNWTR
jgi:Fic family protein